MIHFIIWQFMKLIFHELPLFIMGWNINQDEIILGSYVIVVSHNKSMINLFFLVMNYILTFLGAVNPQLCFFSELISWMVKIRIQRPMKAQVLVMLPSVLLTITACWFLAPAMKEFYLPCWYEAQLAENFDTVIFKLPPAALWLTISLLEEK